MHACIRRTRMFISWFERCFVRFSLFNSPDKIFRCGAYALQSGRQAHLEAKFAAMRIRLRIDLFARHTIIALCVRSLFDNNNNNNNNNIK